MSDRYAVWPCSFVYAGPTTLDLRQVVGWGRLSGAEYTDLIVGGNIDRTARFTGAAAPAFKLQSADLLKILGAVSPSAGLACTGGSTFRLRRRADSGTFATGGVNKTETTTGGWLGLTSLSASQGNQPAAAELMYCPFYDGTNEPVVATPNVDFGSAPTPLFNSLYYLGPVYLGASQLTGLNRTRINFGIRWKFTPTDGDVFPRSGSIYSRMPVISLEFLKADLDESQVGSLFGGALGSTLACYFAAGVNGSTRTAYSSGGHIKISVASGGWNGDDISVAGEDDATLTINIAPTATLSVSTTSTIP